MSTSIASIELVSLAQDLVNKFSGFGDSLKPFNTVFDGEVSLGNSVIVPMFATTDSLTASGSAGLDFSTDGSDAVTTAKVTVSETTKKQVNLKSHEFAKLGNFAPQMINGMLNKISKNVIDAAYALVTSGNFAGVVSASWSESAPTLEKLNTLVEKAKSSGKLDPTSIKVLMPAAGYAVIKTAYQALARDAAGALDFTLIPVYNSGFTKTCITDGSAIAIGFGADCGEDGEQFSFVQSADNTIGYGLHVIADPKYSQKIIGLRSNYGVKVVNPDGLLFAA